MYSTAVQYMIGQQINENTWDYYDNFGARHHAAAFLAHANEVNDQLISRGALQPE